MTSLSQAALVSAECPSTGSLLVCLGTAARSNALSNPKQSRFYAAKSEVGNDDARPGTSRATAAHVHTSSASALQTDEDEQLPLGMPAISHGVRDGMICCFIFSEVSIFTKKWLLTASKWR